jgi:hypothetical protein
MPRVRDNLGPFEPPTDTEPTRRIAFGTDSYADVGEPIPGSGLPADQVQLQPTNIKMLQADPTLGQKEADVLKARYGGETSTEIKSAAPEKPAEQQGPIYDRQRFEQILFQDMGGNPYEIDPMKEVDRITAEEMPKLFDHIFRGKAIWADRGRLSKKQQDFWQNELRQYRANVHDHIVSDRQTKIGMYQFMMNQFDNQAKEEEAKMRRLGQYQSGAIQEKREARLQQRAEQEHATKMMNDRRAIVKRQTELMSEGIDPATGQMSDAAQLEFMELTNQLKSINEMLGRGEKPKDAGAQGAETTEAPQATEEGGTGSDEIVETRKTKSGRTLGRTRSGRIVVIK